MTMLSWFLGNIHLCQNNYLTNCMLYFCIYLLTKSIIVSRLKRIECNARWLR